MAGSPVRVAIVGCGEISRQHLRAIQANEQSLVTVAGVFDSDGARAKARAEEYGITHVYESWNDVLADESAEVIALLLPHDVHARFAIEALDAGHHVVVEKPMGTSIEECDQMIEAARRSGRTLRPVHNRIYDPGTDAVRDFILSGAIGKVFLAQTLGLEPPRTVSVRPWLGTKAGGGGVLLAQAVHPAYLLRWVLGDVAEVACLTSDQKVVDMTAEDTAIAMYRFKSGAIAEMTGTFGLPIGPHEHRITFYGPDGFAEISSRKGIVGLSEKRFGDKAEHSLLEKPEFGTGFQRLWADYAQHFAAGASDGARVTAEDGKRAVEMILGAYRAAAEKRTISLPLGG